MTNEPAAPPPQSVAAPAPIAVDAVPASLAQVPAAELTDLHRRADRYRFLFKTIVTVTAILVGATLIVVLAALLIDM